MLKNILLLLGGLFIMTATATEAEAVKPENKLFIELSTGGTVVIEMFPQLAPKHIERITTLANEGFYDGITFHRVIENFMAQAGDPTGTGGGGSKYPDVVQEFSEFAFDRGIVGAARTAHSTDTFNSQFFICFQAEPYCRGLTGQYTVWGRVIEGMEFVDKIQLTEKNQMPLDVEPDRIVKMTVGEAEKEKAE